MSASAEKGGLPCTVERWIGPALVVVAVGCGPETVVEGGDDPANWGPAPPRTMALVGPFCATPLDGQGPVGCWGEGHRPPQIHAMIDETTVGVVDGCVLDADGTVDCWGADEAPAGAVFSSLDAVDGRVCGLRTDGGIECWGDWDYDAVPPPEIGPFVGVATDGYFAYGLAEDGLVSRWTGYGLPPTELEERFARLAVRNPTCGIRLDGIVRCGSPTSFETPIEGTAVDIAAAQGGGCILDAEHEIRCWGALAGIEPPSGPFVELVVTPSAACGRRASGAIACSPGMGAFTPYGNLFLSNLELDQDLCGVGPDLRPQCWDTPLTDEAPAQPPRQVHARTQCWIDHDGVFDCDPEGYAKPADIDQPLVEVVGMPSVMCGRTESGTLRCWTCDDGVCDLVDGPEGAFVDLAYGSAGLARERFCGIRDDKSITCWNEDMETVDEVEGPFDRLEMSIKDEPDLYVEGTIVCGLRPDATLSCWGVNCCGQADFEGPVVDFALSGGSFDAPQHVDLCMLDDTGSTTCVRLAGDGPPDALPDEEYVDLVGGGESICGLRPDGEIRCRGRLFR